MTFLLLLFLFSPGEEKLNWHDVTIDRMANTTHTHVTTTGMVEMVKKEADGDIHIRLCQAPKSCLTLEIIPPLPLTPPQKGRCIRVWGIARYDRMHLWAEIHPLERWAYATSCPR